MANLRMLVIEDETDDVEVVEMMLHSVGVRTVTAGTVDAAIDQLFGSDYNFDAVIIDLAVPGMDGFELLTEIRRDAILSELPTIAITPFHSPELKTRALDAGFNAYFAKPLDTKAFMGTLRQILN